jgi:formate C-acetyltransferase
MEEYERGQRLRHRVVTVQPHICLERTRLVTGSYRETEGEHVLVRRSKALDRILKNISVYILDDELIVGHQESTQRSAPLFPEFAVEWVDQEIDTFETRPQDRFIVPPEVKEEFRKEIYPYWKGKTPSDRLYSYLTEEIRLQRFVATVFSVSLHEDGGLGHVSLDYEKVLGQGLEGIKEAVFEKLKGLTIWKPGDYKKKLFYESCISMCDSVIGFAKRYGAKAREMAEGENGGSRKEERLQVAENCDRVPMLPARNFHEALQSFWFVQLVPQIYDNGVSISPGRFDQYMYPYYKNDIEDGRLPRAVQRRISRLIEGGTGETRGTPWTCGAGGRLQRLLQRDPQGCAGFHHRTNRTDVIKNRAIPPVVQSLLTRINHDPFSLTILPVSADLCNAIALLRKSLLRLNGTRGFAPSIMHDSIAATSD